ncbi:MAG: DUF4097 family beta strand repeat-containing protein [bacterium]
MRNTSIIVLVILSVIVHPSFSQDNSGEQIIVPLSRPGNPGVLVIDHIKGSINVTGYDGEAVIVKASSGQRLEEISDEIRTDGLRRVASGTIQLNAQEKDNTLVVQTNSHRHTIDLDVTVPRRFNLKLKTYHSGKITVKDVTGEMEITNVNGDVILDGIKGSAVVNTIDGDIFVRFTEVTPGIPMAFTSIEGKIDVTFPQDLRARLKIKTDNGEIFSNYEIQMEKRKIQGDRSDVTGLYKVSLEDWVQGTINGGGPELLFKSLEGNIYIRKQK